MVSSGNIQVQLEINFSNLNYSLQEYFPVFRSYISGAEHLRGDKHGNAEPVTEL